MNIQQALAEFAGTYIFLLIIIVTGNAIAIGNTNGTTSLTQRVGTGNFSLDGVAASTYTIASSTMELPLILSISLFRCSIIFFMASSILVLGI